VMDVARTLAEGRYELGEEIGSGGSGSVRQARDTLLDRPVAVKLLRRGGSDETVRARMRAEARLAGSVVHPGIARVYDYGEDDSGAEPTPYIVMQQVGGVSLYDVLEERGMLPPAETMRIVAQVAEALQAAHEAGIVHRDLKPGNLLLTPEGGVVIVDFGIARVRGAEPLTVTGTIVGTVDYISPEQAEGRSATPRSDLYSLGMVAYECLSGRKPFRRETELATALAHLREDAPELGPEVPASVRALVSQMIAKDPESRPADATEVARRAAALSRPSTVVLPPPALQAQVARTPALAGALRLPRLRTRRAYVAAAVLVAAVAGSGLVAARSPAARVPDVRGESWAQARHALDSRGLAARRDLVDDPSADRGTVVGQDVAAGTNADEGAVVTLSVASGRTDLARADVLGESWRAAARDLVELGLVPERATRAQASDAGEVVAVSDAGRLPLGATVTLTVAVDRGPEPAADGAGATTSASPTTPATTPTTTRTTTQTATAPTRPSGSRSTVRPGHGHGHGHAWGHGRGHRH